MILTHKVGLIQLLLIEKKKLANNYLWKIRLELDNKKLTETLLNIEN